MLLWHIAGTTALTRYAFRDELMDLRFLLLGAVLPDLIDTPIGLAFFGSLQTVRLAAHTLLFGAIVMAAIVLSTRRGRPRKRWMPIAIGLLFHLMLDAMWNDPETLLWPLFGLEFSQVPATTAADFVADILASPQVWAGELVGLVYIAVLARRAKVASDAAGSEFMATGRIAAPIGFSRS